MIRFLAVILLVAVGVLGLVLPLLPGWPFLLIALYMLGLVSKRRLLKGLKRLGGKRGGLLRKLIACLIIKVVYRKRLNLK